MTQNADNIMIDWTVCPRSRKADIHQFHQHTPKYTKDKSHLVITSVILNKRQRNQPLTAESEVVILHSCSVLLEHVLNSACSPTTS